MNQKKILKYLAIAFTLLGLALAMFPFLKSMSPPDGVIYKWQTEIDISKQSIGELIEYSNNLGAIWVYRRTPEQIEWLSSYTPTIVNDYVLGYTHSEAFGGNHRSINPEYFVFTEWKMNGKTYLQEGRAWHNCGIIKYHDGDIKVSEEKIYKGVIACMNGHNSPKFEHHMFVYDVAGVAYSPYVAPLEVPYYEYNESGKIIVGPRP